MIPPECRWHGHAWASQSINILVYSCCSVTLSPTTEWACVEKGSNKYNLFFLIIGVTL